MSANILEIHHLTKRFSDFTLDNLNLAVEPGTITGLVGANGAGKSTTIKLILNLLRRDAGEIRVFGLDNIRDAAAVRQQIGVVFDEPCFHEILTPRQVGCYMRGLYAQWDTEVYTSYLHRFGLPENKKVKEFSRGMKMKLSIAAALSHNPRLLLLDEPTSGLDPLVRDEILDIFLEFLQDDQRAVVLSTHITSDLDKIADTIAMLSHGRLVFHEEKDALRDKYVLVKGSREQLGRLGRDRLIGLRENSFGGEALCMRADLAGCPELAVERPTVEEIMLSFSRQEKNTAAGDPARQGGMSL